MKRLSYFIQTAKKYFFLITLAAFFAASAPLCAQVTAESGAAQEPAIASPAAATSPSATADTAPVTAASASGTVLKETTPAQPSEDSAADGQKSVVPPAKRPRKPDGNKVQLAEKCCPGQKRFA